MKLNFMINMLALIFFASSALVFGMVATQAINKAYEGEVLGGYYIEEDPTVNLEELPESTAHSLHDTTVTNVTNINTTETSTGSMFDEAFEWIERPYRLLVIPQTYFEEDATFRKDITIEGGLEINDIDYIFPDEDNEGVLTSDGQGNLTWEAIAAGITDFLGLSDTPNSYSGSGSQFVAVNGAGTGLEFVAAPSGTTISGTDNRLARFNAAGDNVENSSLNDLYTGGIALTVDSNGRIGIATTAPENRLTVAGNASIGAGYTGIGLTAPQNGLLVQGRVGIGNTNPAYLLDIGGTTRTWNLITQNVSLSSLYSSVISGNFGSGGFTNFTGGIGTGGMGNDTMPAVNRLTSTGNLQNIGSVQAGETHLTKGGTFLAGVGYTAGNGTRGLTIGDFNGDSDLDIAAANPSSNTVSVFLNNGDGTLAAKADYTAASAFMVTSADFNGDGALDLASTDNTDLRISILMNNGDGTYASEVTYTAGASPRGIVAGDLNGDGKADLAVTELAGNIAIYINNGNGTFGSRVAYPATASGPFKIRMSDFNGDGYADLAYTVTHAFIGVLINDGDGTFGSEITYASNPSGTTYGLAVGDVDGDSMPDIVASNTGVHTVSVFINNGDGTFAPDVEYGTGTNPRGLSLGDITGDGKPDISVVSGGASTLSVLINNGNGTFATKVDYATTNSSNFSVEMGDLNGDGKADLVSSTLTSPGKITVYMNTSSTILMAKASNGYVGIGTSGPSYLLDVNGTGRVTNFITDNVILSSLYSSIVAPVSGFGGFTNFSGGIGTGGAETDILPQMLRLTASGNLQNIGSIQAGETHLTNGGTFLVGVGYTAANTTRGLTFADFNGDSSLDMAAANAGSDSVSVFINNGDGTYAAKVDYTVNGAFMLDSADFNGDGAEDLTVTNVDDYEVSVLMNDGDGTFASAVDYASALQPRGVVAGDVNGDGKADIAVAELLAGVAIYINNGSGTFASRVTYTATSPFQIKMSDVNGDGYADLVYTTGAANFGVLLNDGDGTFGSEATYAINAAATSFGIAAMDVNGDSMPDVIVPNNGGGVNTVSVFINDGDGTFASDVEYATGTSPGGVSIGDVTGDGYPDIATANTSASTISVLANNGNGTFATKVDYATPDPSNYAVEMADVNGDGKLDLGLASITDPGTVTIYMNNPSTMLFAQASTGRIGMGISNPGWQLDVTGSASIGNNLLAQLEGGTFFGRTRLSENQLALLDSSFGGTWMARGSSLDWRDIALSSSGKYQTAVPTGGNIYTSSDYGITWVSRNSSRDWRGVAVSSDGKYQTSVVFGGNIYTSSDYGVTWTSRASTANWHAVGMSGEGKYQVAASYGGPVYKSSDYGVTWVETGSVSETWITFAMSSDGKYIVGTPDSGFIYTSYDYGASWTARDSSRLWRGASMSSDGKYMSAVETGGQIYTSSDYGVTWTARDSNRDWFDISVSADGKYQVATNSSGSLYVSSDYGATWSAKASSQSWRNVAISSDGKYATAVVEGGGQIYTTGISSYIAGGNFGIGSTNPGSVLSVSGNAAFGALYSEFVAPTNGMIVQGAVGIGTTNAGSHALSVVGTAGLSTGTAWTNTSDSRFKDVQSEIKGSALEKLSQLRPVTYEWNDLHDEMFGEDEGLNYGFIAQEIGEVIPEMVTQDAQGFYYYNPSGFESILTAAVQEQQDMIDEIRERLDTIDTQSEETSNDEEENITFDLSNHPVLEDLSEILEIQDTEEGGKRTVFFSDMNVAGNITADSFSTLGEITVGFLAINSDDNSISVLGGETLRLQSGINPGNIEAFDGTIVLTPEGGITAKAEVTAKAVVTEKVAILGASTIAEQLEDSEGIEADSTVGEGILGAGQLEVLINNINVSPESKIFVTATTATGGKMLNVKTKSDGSFVVAIDSVHSAEIKFDYWIIEVR